MSALGTRTHGDSRRCFIIYVSVDKITSDENGNKVGNNSTIYVETPKRKEKWVETDIPNAMTMVIEDEETGLTMIWVDVPDPEEETRVGS